MATFFLGAKDGLGLSSHKNLKSGEYTVKVRVEGDGAVSATVDVYIDSEQPGEATFSTQFTPSGVGVAEVTQPISLSSNSRVYFDVTALSGVTVYANAASEILEGFLDARDYGLSLNGVDDDSDSLQNLIDSTRDPIFIANGNALIHGVTLKDGRSLILGNSAKIKHASNTGVCLTVEQNTSIDGGELYHDATGSSYSGVLLSTLSTAKVSRANPINIRTSLQCLGQHQGTGLLVEADGTNGDAWVQWSRFDVNCTSLQDAVRVYAHDGATNTVFINGNEFRIRAQNCDNVLNTEGYVGQSGIGGNDFHLIVQASSNSERVAIMRALTDNKFYCQIFDWHSIAANAQPFYRPAGSGEHYNYRNHFYGVEGFYDFISNTTIGDMRLGGTHNKIITGKYGSPLRVDSTAANTSDLYVSSNAEHNEGHLWWNENNGKLEFSNGTTIETVTSA